METPTYCTVSPRLRLRDGFVLSALTVSVLLVHGYHPWAEDGGLYVTGVEYLLNPRLFPQERVFVTEHLGYSVFAPVLAELVRISHLSLATVLLSVYLFTTALTLWACLWIARSCFRSHAAQWTAVCLVAAWWTLPIAGTSLLLMDPYVTARSFSTPLSLIAVAVSLQPWDRRRPVRYPGNQSAFATVHPAIVCTIALVAAALFHPLMAGYALGFVLLLRLAIERRPIWIWLVFAVAVLVGACVLQAFASPASSAVNAAVYSRYYWFLSQWHWFEWMGLAAPVAILFAFLYRPHCSTPQGRAAPRASIVLGAVATATAALFAQEHFRAHAVARLQPLRAFLLIYIVMILFLGAACDCGTERLACRVAQRFACRAVRALPFLFIAASALLMYRVQRACFPSSVHLEIPGRTNPNPWVQAFVWCREHTSSSALFGLDARYINTPGEDAQVFRAIAQRSAIPDFSKDGGEAAISPGLAQEWERAAKATAKLSVLDAKEQDKQLQAFGVDWLVLHADAPDDNCPYRNWAVKVCRVHKAANG